ncbi:MAG: o-succinylbenzoate synthase [Cyclobacteriaceae bacterium]
MKLEYKPYTLDFKFEAGTSRGSMTKRKIWILNISEGSKNGIGEVAPLFRLSIEDEDDVIDKLDHLATVDIETPETRESAYVIAEKYARECPSVRMGLEMALIDFVNGSQRQWFKGDFTNGRQAIPINGLIWMGSLAEMKAQVDKKLELGFDCIKMKIGAINWEDELKLLAYTRELSKDLILRVDANGAFAVNKAVNKLNELAPFDLHSIEQPILPGQPEAMQLLCSMSKVPIALDEELIDKTDDQEKNDLLNDLKPQYLVLKPSLLGGFAETQKWIRLAEQREIGWWITSALESNIGLNAISQFTSQFSNLGHQGLGTGQLYHNNFHSKAKIDGQLMTYNPNSLDETLFDI